MTRRQTDMAAALTGLSSLLYMVPGAQAKALGGAAWLGCLAALPPLALLGYLLGKRPSRTPSRLLSAVLGLWLTLAAAAVLHGCAARYCTALGIFRSPLPYAAVLLMVAVPAAMSRKQALFRAAEIFLPVVLALLGLALLCALKQLRPARLIDLTQLSATGVLKAALPVVAVGLAALVLPRLFAPVQPGAAPAATLAVTAALLSAAAVGTLGAPMTARLELPVFTMLRNLGLLHTVERLDALITAVWVLPDVTALSLLLRAGGEHIGRSLAIPQQRHAALGVSAAAAALAAIIQIESETLPHRLAPVLAAGIVAITMMILVQKKA